MNMFAKSALWRRVGLALAATTLVLAGCNGGSSSPGGSSGLSGGGGGDPAAPTVNITVSPSSTSGDANIQWTSGNTSSCTASQPAGQAAVAGWLGDIALSGNTTVGPLTTGVTYAFQITCSGPTGAASTTGPITLGSSGPTPPAVFMQIVPGTVVTPNTVATLQWTSSNAHVLHDQREQLGRGCGDP